ncbi:M16 family metallopeptidase [Butyricimonas paravirosa]|uniref:M16 family metallopeptidase n=1 Tax=Butyricimonas paravirosa TaxID=1472417 RepID=UPI0021093CF6|nr:M16 family metallopeptidase [Butyricimonas paravirosa]MCQ4872998.1 insulinase family protein [Butyricimonas paravirosa]
MKRGYALIILLCSWQLIFAQEQGDVFRHGKLKNGLTYYVRHSKTTPRHADFYLVQNVGALLEEDNQNGLAHFLEHMAFNGSESFKEGIPRFLNRRGIKQFNAMTGQDETIYHINYVPVSDQSLVDSCLLVLKDWSGFLLLNPVEIDKERGVIFEERRSRRDVNTRIREQVDPYVFNHSRYATRDVIGTVEVLSNFTPEELRAYYHDFYRPDQQAVIIVGDVDAIKIEEKIRQMFGSIPKRENPKPRFVCEIPDNLEPYYVKVQDKEITSPSIILTKRIREDSTLSPKERLRNNLLQQFYNKIMEKQLEAYINARDPFFTMTMMNHGKLVRNYNRWQVYVQAYPGKERQALKELLEAIERVKRFFLNEKELKKQVDAYLPGLEETGKNKDRLANSTYVQLYQNNFLEGNPVLSVEEDVAFSREILSKLTAKDLQEWVDSWYNDDKNWIYVMQSADASYDFPTRDEITKIRHDASLAELNALDFDLTAVPLMDFEVKGGEIVKEKNIKMLDAEEWTLSNGAKVYYKFTKADGVKVSLMGESKGGMSLLPAGDLPSAAALSRLMMRSGLYKHDMRMMQEILKGHHIVPNIALNERSEGVSAYCDSVEAKMMFQIIYLFFEKPRFSRDDFDKFVYMSKMQEQNKVLTVNDTIAEQMKKLRVKDSPRLWEVNEAYYDAMNYDKMVAIYKDRFQDAFDFTFYLTGNIPREEARTLVRQYLGAIPSIYRKEQPVKHSLKKEGSITETIEANLPDEKYYVNIEFSNKLKLKSEEDLAIDIIQLILNNRYRDIIREDEGGSYGVNVDASYSKGVDAGQYLGVSFETNTTKGDRMRAIVHEQIRKLVDEGVSDEDVEDAVLMMRKGRASVLGNRGNAHWMEALRYYAETGKDIDSPAYFEKPLEKLNGKAVQALAKKFFDSAECVDIVVKSKE